jgi:hypothetical protein
MVAMICSFAAFCGVSGAKLEQIVKKRKKALGAPWEKSIVVIGARASLTFKQQHLDLACFQQFVFASIPPKVPPRG